MLRVVEPDHARAPMSGRLFFSFREVDTGQLTLAGVGVEKLRVIVPLSVSDSRIIFFRIFSML